MDELKKVEVNELKTVDVLAAEINSIKEQTKKILLQSSIEIGKRLVMAKNQIDHGRWGEWVEVNVQYSQRTASNLMKLYEEYREVDFLESNSQALADLSYTKAVALLGIPAEEREVFIKENDVEAMSSRELEKAIKERDEALAKQDALQTTLETLAEEVEDKIAEKAEVEKEKTSLQAKVISSQHVIDRLEVQLSELKKENLKQDSELKIKEFEEKINQIKGEKEEAEKRYKTLEIQLTTQKDLSSMKYKIYFDDLIKKFNDLVAILNEMKSSDKAEYDKYRKATIATLDRIKASI